MRVFYSRFDRNFESTELKIASLFACDIWRHDSRSGQGSWLQIIMFTPEGKKSLPKKTTEREMINDRTRKDTGRTGIRIFLWIRG